MNKKSKSIEDSVLILTEEEINSLINEYSFKYQIFKEIDSTLIASMLKDIVVSKNSTIMQIKTILDREILTYLCMLIRNLNRREIINKILIFYDSVFDNILNKIGFTDDINIVKRRILLEVVQAYEGQDDFIAMYTRYASNIKRKVPENKIDKIISELNPIYSNNKIESISLLGNSLNILHDITLEDPDFIRFVILKFGYNGYYLDDESIKSILSLTEEEFNKFMAKALEVMSNSSKVKPTTETQKIIIKS